MTDEPIDEAEMERVIDMFVKLGGDHDATAYVLAWEGWTEGIMLGDGFPDQAKIMAGLLRQMYDTYRHDPVMLRLVADWGAAYHQLLTTPPDTTEGL